jgi:hypothetical protein
LGWPVLRRGEFKKAYAAFVRQMKMYVGDMVKELKDPNFVYYFDYNPIVGDPYGEDWHPTNEFHAAMAEEIAPFIQKSGF